MYQFLKDKADQENDDDNDDDGDDDDEGDDDDDDDDGDDEKLSALYGREWKQKSPENLMDDEHFGEIPEFLESRKKTLTGNTVSSNIKLCIT